MNPKDLEKECAAYMKQYEVEIDRVVYTTAAEAQYGNDLDHAQLQSIIDTLERQEAEKKEMNRNMQINRIKDAYKTGLISRGQAAINLQNMKMNGLDIVSYLEKWDNAPR